MGRFDVRNIFNYECRIYGRSWQCRSKKKLPGFMGLSEFKRLDPSFLPINVQDAYLERFTRTDFLLAP
jgi:hypothetical protein